MLMNNFTLIQIVACTNSLNKVLIYSCFMLQYCIILCNIVSLDYDKLIYISIKSTLINFVNIQLEFKY
jgi:hypothetical protein